MCDLMHDVLLYRARTMGVLLEEGKGAGQGR